MFKIEVNVNGVTHGHYNMNRYDDNFTKFLPKVYTRKYGELITKDELTIYKINEDYQPLLEGKLEQHASNILDCSAIGKIRVYRRDEAKTSEGDYLPLDKFTELVEARESIFADTATPQAVTIPATVPHDFGNGVEDAILIPADHELSASYSTLELELVGVALTQWSYDVNGKFLGNN